MIKAIIFDCFGVLATDDIQLAFRSTLPPEVDIEQVVALNKAYDKAIIDYDTFRQGVWDITGQFPPNLQALHSGDMGKNVPLLALIQYLKADFKVGLLSNISSDWITKEFLTPEEQQLFDTMVLSYEIGMVKPDPRIYTLVCERLRVTPEEALMVDDRHQYVEGAREIGMSGIVYEDMRSFTQQLNELLNTDY